jgi:hypothetical protein
VVPVACPLIQRGLELTQVLELVRVLELELMLLLMLMLELDLVVLLMLVLVLVLPALVSSVRQVQLGGLSLWRQVVTARTRRRFLPKACVRRAWGACWPTALGTIGRSCCVMLGTSVIGSSGAAAHFCTSPSSATSSVMTLEGISRARTPQQIGISRCLRESLCHHSSGAPRRLLAIDIKGFSTLPLTERTGGNRVRHRSFPAIAPIQVRS